ncbi:MAG TPA: protein kinase [Bryobacteraceae bacterium]|nr:protein kinase [Bryobacteraceae bacterium]
MTAPSPKGDSMIGLTLRHYRIESKLGAGGMGIVFRARDTHLDRPVAIKVLPAAASADSDRRGRLAQEARAASALNHPNIITIYEIGSEVSDGQRVDFIAMEYVAGKPLDRLIGRKGMKLVDALKCAIQVADALAAAHASGIVHRDLKPANVMVTDQGLVKVLDFGLAKLTEPAKADAFAQTESVQIPALTEAGTIIGTVAYMSPEQAEAKDIDSRSDVFSFGAMLYEMLTGRRAFLGDSKLSVLATILQKDPTPIRELAEGVPRELEKIIARCLQKDARQRWQSMADLKLALADLVEDIDANRLSSPSPASRQKGWRRWIWPAVAALLVTSGAAAYAFGRLHKTEPPSYSRLTFRRGDVTNARFNADGRTIIFSARWDGAPSQIYTAVPGNRESRSLGLPEGRIISVSPTGELAFLRGSGDEGTLARVPLAGGTPRDMLDNVIDADWGPDSEKIAVLRTVNGKTRIEYPIGKVLYETDSHPPVSMRLSPKGDWLAYFEYQPQIGDFDVAVINVSTGVKRYLSRGWRGLGYLGWSPKADEVWFSATRLGDEPAIRAASLAGGERIVSQAPSFLLIRDISRDGSVLMAVTSTRIAMSFHSDAEGKDRDLSWLDTSKLFDLSSDGSQALFLEVSYGEGRNTSIYLRKTDGSPAVLLGYGNRPALSPDGKSVVAIQTNPNRQDLVVLPTGAGEPRFLTSKGMRYEQAEWFPDGRSVLFTASEPGHQVRTFAQDVAGGQPRAVTPEGVRASRVTPDGKYVVIVRGDKFCLQPISGGEPRAIGPAGPGERPLRWTPDGKVLYLSRIPADGLSVQFLRLNIATGEKTEWRAAAPSDPVGVGVSSAAITPDGREYAYSYQRDLSNLYVLKGLK